MSLGGSHMVSFGLGLAGRQASAEMVETLRRHAEPLPPPERAEEFGAFFDRYGDARVVLLGEATHGTSEFYRARAAIHRQLLAHHGFNTVAVEADWPDAANLAGSEASRVGNECVCPCRSPWSHDP